MITEEANIMQLQGDFIARKLMLMEARLCECERLLEMYKDKCLQRENLTFGSFVNCVSDALMFSGFVGTNGDKLTFSSFVSTNNNALTFNSFVDSTSSRLTFNNFINHE